MTIAILQPRSHRRRNSSAWTLVEMMVAIAASMLIMGSIMTVMVFTMRSFRAIGNYGELNQSSRYALDLMNRDIRNAAGVSSYTTATNGSITAITLTNTDASTISYNWDPTATTVSYVYARGGSSVSKVLLTNCDAFAVSLYKRTPGANLTFVAATNASEAKIIYMDWKCSRLIGGSKQNTESVQTAQITLRN